MADPATWTNPSVLLLTKDGDPVQEITNRARDLALRAVDLGWKGPPFDPFRLAELLGFKLVPTSDVLEARLLASAEGKATIEYNPSRPRGRLRYSIAHEIAHTLIEDWPDKVRHRGFRSRLTDEWQLESLCNVAAAELLMPAGDCGAIADPDIGINALVDEQQRFEVSTEALLLKAVRVRLDDCAAFCASNRGQPAADPYRLDYVVGSRTWSRPVGEGTTVPAQSVVADCRAVGFTATADEVWNGQAVRVECVAIPAYPGELYPRVVGIMRSFAHGPLKELPALQVVKGDATLPRADGLRVIAHIVNDQSQVWGGAGFAASLRRRFPSAQTAFRDWVISDRSNQALGRTHWCQVADDIVIASMVAQHGYGPSDSPRIRYEALRHCLLDVGIHARSRHASVHMPPIGTGNAGGQWPLIQEILEDTLVSFGISVTVYQLPERMAPPK